MELRQGTYLQGDKYRIIKTLGQGGFGITYLAEQVNLGRKVCIKEFFPKEYYNRDNDSQNISIGVPSCAEIMEAYKQKFLKEARNIASLKHPNIIDIHDAFEENNTAYYVMEYIEGVSLHDCVAQQGALSESDAIKYIRAIAGALNYIHQRKIMHLDVKPANIMLRTNDKCAILIDFGLSKQYDSEGNQTSSTPVGISHGYAPMEQYISGGIKEFSPETDIYSLGATLYNLATGKVPPQAAAIASDGLPTLPTTLSANVRKAIECAMEDKRKNRPHSIEEFLNILDKGLDTTPQPKSTADDKTEIMATGSAKTEIKVEQPKTNNTPKVEPTPTPKPSPKQTPKPASEPIEPKPARKPVEPKPIEKPQSKSNSKWVWIVLLLLLVVGGIGGAMFLLMPNDKDVQHEVIPVPNNKIWYTSSDDEIVEPYKTDMFGDAVIVSNTYSNGKGIITFDRDITTIGWQAFGGCKSLTSITIPNSVTTIGESAFSRCSSLKEFKGKYAVDNGRCLIKDNAIIAYANASGTQYTIPNSVTTIGRSAFNFCESLTSITIPNSVTTIGGYAFYCCESLTTVYCKATTPPKGGSEMFLDTPETMKIYVPRDAVNAYKRADGWRDYAKRIEGYDF